MIRGLPYILRTHQREGDCGGGREGSVLSVFSCVQKVGQWVKEARGTLFLRKVSGRFVV